MNDVLVGRLMSNDPHAVGPDTLVEEAASVLLDNEIGSVLVTDDDDRLLGILTSTDFVRIVAKSKPKAETTVERYMTTDVVTATAQDSVADVAEAMIDHGFHHMPVVDETEGVIGIISTTDLTAYVSSVQTLDAP